MKCPESDFRFQIRERAQKWAVTLYGLNIGDLLFTLFFLTRGFEEGNPAMAYVWAWSPTLFILVKVFLIGFLIWGYHSIMRRRWHLWALKAMTIVYGLLVCYHISGLLYFFL